MIVDISDAINLVDCIELCFPAYIKVRAWAKGTTDVDISLLVGRDGISQDLLDNYLLQLKNDLVDQLSITNAAKCTRRINLTEIDIYIDASFDPVIIGSVELDNIIKWFNNNQIDDVKQFVKQLVESRYSV